MDETAVAPTRAAKGRLLVTRYVGLLASHAMKETLDYARRASSDSLPGTVALGLTPLAVLGYYIFLARGAKEFWEWAIAAGIAIATVVVGLIILFLIAFIKSPLATYRALMDVNAQFRADLTTERSAAQDALLEAKSSGGPSLRERILSACH